MKKVLQNGSITAEGLQEQNNSPSKPWLSEQIKPVINDSVTESKEQKTWGFCIPM